jgi:hypothetical protein
MLGKALRKLDYRLAIAGLVVIAIGTIVAAAFGGFRLAGLVGFLLFMFLDGLSCTWTIVSHSTAEKLHEEADAAERDHFAEKTKDDPTLR